MPIWVNYIIVYPAPWQASQASQSPGISPGWPGRHPIGRARDASDHAKIAVDLVPKHAKAPIVGSPDINVGVDCGFNMFQPEVLWVVYDCE